jgi:hypothetical protein
MDGDILVETVPSRVKFPTDRAPERPNFGVGSDVSCEVPLFRKSLVTSVALLILSCAWSVRVVEGHIGLSCRLQY